MSSIEIVWLLVQAFCFAVLFTLAGLGAQALWLAHQAGLARVRRATSSEDSRSA